MRRPPGQIAGNGRSMAFDLIRQPCGLPPSPKGKALPPLRMRVSQRQPSSLKGDMRMRRLIRPYRIYLCIILLLALSLPARASEPFAVAAKGAALIDGDTGRVLFGQNENRRLPMASTTKVMTALLALENAGLDEPVTASKNASGVPGTSLYLSVGETLSMEHMLYGLMLRSGNDAAVAIAEHVAGSVTAFAEMMNARAAELGAWPSCWDLYWLIQVAMRSFWSL